MGGEDGDGISPEEQDALLREIGIELLGAVPSDWTEIRFVEAALVDIQSPSLDVVRAEGMLDWAQPPAQASRLLGDLRRGMYKPGLGTWYTARITITPPGESHVEFDYDNEPRFPFEITPTSYALDLEYFSRYDDATPDWLRVKLAEAADLELTEDGFP